MSRLSLEPPVPHLPGRRAGQAGDHLTARLGSGDLLRLGAIAAALGLVLSSSGDAFLVAVLLGAATADAVVFTAVGAAAVTLLVRWGTSSLSAVAGAQAVLGPAALTGTPLDVAATWCAGLGVLFVASASTPAGLIAGALTAGLVVAGPAATSVADALVRAAGAAGALLAGAVLWRLVPARVVRLVGMALSAAAVGLAAAS